MDSNIIHEAAQKASHTCFKWGKNDCCLFVADILEKKFGVDYSENFRGKYKTLLTTHKMMRSQGVVSLDELYEQVASNYGWSKVDKPEIFDVGYFSMINGAIMSIFDGMFWVTKTEGGVIFIKKPPIKMWRVKPCHQ